MRLLSLQSGSNGNSVYVEAGGVRLLIDAGISGCRAQARLAAMGVDIRRVDGVLVTHDHRDHIASAGIFHRKFALPIHVTEATLEAGRRHRLGPIAAIRPFDAGDVLRFGRVRIETVPTPHDGTDGVAVIVDDGHRRIGILTDLGHPFSGLDAVLDSLDAVLLESNYDPAMLEACDRPEHVKQRIRGPAGHISNDEAATLLARLVGRRLQWACLGHLSADNNVPELALRTSRQRTDARLPLHLASRDRAVGWLHVA